MSAFRRVVTIAAGSALVVALLGVFPGSPAGALTSYTVTATEDGAPGSLRDVLDQANADGDASEISLPAGATLELDVCGDAGSDENGNASGDLDATDGEHDLTIWGNGATIRQTCATQRVFHAQNAGSNVRFVEVTLTGGDAASGSNNGGGLAVEGPGDVSVERSTIEGNTAANIGGGIAASALDFDAFVFIVDSTVAGNTALGSSGGGLFTLGANLVVNSTFSGNTAGRSSGAIVGDTELIYATIVGNGVVTEGGGTQLDIGALSTYASVIAEGFGGSSSCLVSTVTSGGWNVDDDGSCDLGDATDQTVADVEVGPLADNGGPTRTHLPEPGSPLLDNVPVGSCDPTYVADQRNVSRPQRPGCDTGSVEVEVDTPTTTSTTAPGGGSSSPLAPGTAARAVPAQPRFTG